MSSLSLGKLRLQEVTRTLFTVKSPVWRELLGLKVKKIPGPAEHGSDPHGLHWGPAPLEMPMPQGPSAGSLACPGSLLSLQASHQAGWGLPTEALSPPRPQGGCTHPRAEPAIACIWGGPAGRCGQTGREGARWVGRHR